jgi:hypothetical protein
MLISDLHPIKATRMETAYPLLCCPLKILRTFGKSEAEKLAERREELQGLLDTEKDESKLAKMTGEERKLFRLRLKNMQKEVRAKADLLNGDPYDSLGFGMHAYRSTLFTLFLTFSAISIIMLPVLGMYGTGPKGFEEYVDPGVPRDIKNWAKLSIANLGYSSMQCSSIPLNQKSLPL